ncbi:MAG: hypothetical protein WKF67_03425 [Rubrobacteraceae bacterium]
MEEIALTRSRAKHPPQKVAVEAQRIKKKVEKSDTNRRQKMKVDDPRNLRLAEMDRDIEAKNREEQNMTNASEIKADEVRLSQAESLNARADEFMRTHDVDYPTAVREVVRLTQSGQSEPSVAEVEKYMRDNDVDDFGVALRGVVQDGQDRGQAFGSTPTGGISVEDENTALQKIIEERGCDA